MTDSKPRKAAAAAAATAVTAPAAPTRPRSSLPQTVAAVVLLAVYAAIPVVGLAGGLTQVIVRPSHMIESGPLVAFLAALSSDGEAAAQLLPKLLLPLTAVFTGASIDRVRAGPALGWLFLLPLVGVLASLALSVLFEMASSVSIAGQRAAIVALGYEMATNLGTYLMLSLGLQVSTLQTKGG